MNPGSRKNMTRIRTHYDNLKVMRNAPPEVIRAAYRSLSQKYHPDRNPSDPDAERIMLILNAAYETLSDPVRRAEHDEWIRATEAANEPKLTSSSSSEHRSTATSDQNDKPTRTARDTSQAPLGNRRTSSSPPKQNASSKWWTGGVIALALVGVVIRAHDFIQQQSAESAFQVPSAPFPLSGTNALPPQTPPITQHVQPTTPPTRSRYEDSSYLTAPNGRRWPVSAGYIDGYPILRSDGRSTLTVDNSRNNSHVFVKLMAVNQYAPLAVRHFFVPAFSQFTLEKLTAGNYELRYRELTTGNLFRSDHFELKEIENALETKYKYRLITSTRGGESDAAVLSEGEF